MPKGTRKRTKPAWNKGLPRTEEAKRKQRETVLLKYGVSNVSQVPDVKNKISASHSTPEWKAKVKETKKLRYGNPNYNNMEKNRQTKLDRYGDPKYNNPDKNTATKHINHTFNTSSYEKDMYEYLVEKYGHNHVLKEYKDSRYPFNCDFYIDTKDLFIELNIHPCHNFHSFNPNNLDDINKLNILQEKAKTSDYYKNIIYVWTVSDPQKQQIASKNKLNYIMLYSKRDIEEAIKNNLL